MSKHPMHSTNIESLKLFILVSPQCEHINLHFLQISHANGSAL